jgi:hypothetical protein
MTWELAASMLPLVRRIVDDLMASDRQLLLIEEKRDLLFQKRSYGACQIEPSSPESEDEELARALFDWSKNEVSRHLGVVVE